MQATQTKQYPNAVRLGDIVLGKNPRRGDNPSFTEIRASIKEKGVIQPVLVRPLENGRFELRAGFTRFNAAKLELGEEYLLPIHVREMSDEEADEASLIENVIRGDMNPAEEAEAASKLLARCEGNREEAAKRLGWSRSTLDKRLGLMNCVADVRDALIGGTIQLGLAELLAAIAKEKQAAVLKAMLGAPKMPSIAEFKASLSQIAMKLQDACFDKQECAGCPNNSGNQQALFGESIGEGNCTNKDCFDRKTEETLVARQVSLKDEYPTVRIVRPGENFSVIRLVAEGATGVGVEQAKACKGCEHYGAAVSGVPGKIGNVYRGLCFDSACNTKKVEAQQKVEKDAEKAAVKAVEKAKATGENPEQAATKAKDAVKAQAKEAAPAKAQDSSRVKEYRLKTWRTAVARQVARHPELNDTVLLATAISGNGGKFNGAKLRAVFEALTKSQLSASYGIADMMDAVVQTDEKVKVALRTALAASVAEGVEEHELVKLAARCGTDLSHSWKVGADYLDLLTKSEMEVVAEQIGLKGHLDEKAFAKVFTGKKDEIVKKFLAVEGFEFAGKIPSNMAWSK